MKLNKETLKRIIKEELDAVMNETMTIPPIGGDITPEQQLKIDDLINSGEEDYINQARSLVDGLGGNPEYVDALLNIEYQGVTSMAHQHRDVIDTFPDPKDATDQDHRDFYNATSNYEGEERQKIADRYSDTPETASRAGRMYGDAMNSRIRK
jgi:hypothetical protein|tara:strand:- start:56 stop:514 length:459 start_codon:yes stop_codon:yes gene_type:complete